MLTTHNHQGVTCGDCEVNAKGVVTPLCNVDFGAFFYKVLFIVGMRTYAIGGLLFTESL